MANEITVKLKQNIKEIKNILEEKGFKAKEKFIVDDTYFIPANLEIKGKTPREILKKAVLLRDITDLEPYKKIKKFTFKEKEINEKGEIIRQQKTECPITDIEAGKKFIEKIGFKELMRIKEYDVVYKKNDLNIILKNVENSDDMMEVELVEENENLNSIDKIKREVQKLNLPIDVSDYFVKKAEIELEKVLERKEETQIGE